ncbi:hypothetical protein EPO15_02045 [bacterium]|nr:MAG: hypothetical protein EPO15_02045 [bacterium]
MSTLLSLLILLAAAGPAHAWGKKLSVAEEKALEAEKASKERADIRASYLQLIEKAPQPASVSVLSLDGKTVSVPVAELPGRLKDGDVVRLEPGVYRGLAGLQKRNIRVVGKGPYETFINTQGVPLPVNGTEFWDLSLVDTPFITAGHDGVFTVGAHVVGATDVEALGGEGSLSIGLGIAVGDYSTAVIPSSVPVYSVFSLHAPRPSNAGRWDYAFGPVDVDSFAFDAKLDTPFSFRKSPTKGRWLGNPAFYAKLAADGDSLWTLLASTKTMYPLEPHHRIAYKRLLAKVGEYAAVQGHAAPVYDQAAYQALAAKADAAKQAGFGFVALALYQDANLLSRFTHNSELVRRAQDAAHDIRDGLRCEVADTTPMPPHAYAELLRNELPRRVPAMALSRAGVCRLLVSRVSTGSTLISKSTGVVARTAVYQETAASKQRRAAEERARYDAAEAADRAASRARQARWDAAVESMQGTAAKLEAGRVRVEGVGGRSVMSYGSGDFRGGASAGTVAAYDAAMRQKAQAEAAAATAGSGVEQEFAGYSETTRESGTSSNGYVAFVTPVFAGEYLPPIKGMPEKYVKTRTCDTTTSANGVFKTAKCDTDSDVKTWRKQQESSVLFNLAPGVIKLVEARLLQRLKPRATAAKRKDPLSEADAYLYRRLGIFGIVYINDDAAVRREIFGDVRPPLELTTNALAF